MIKRWLKRNILNRKKTYEHEIYMPKLAEKIKQLLIVESNKIPVFVVSYNNGVYVDNTCNQLFKKNIKPIVIDNASNDHATINILKKLEQSNIASVVYSEVNFGHLVGFYNPIYSILPEVFAYTDPDLQYNENLPINFLDILSDLTDEYKVFKAGFALNYLMPNRVIDNCFETQRDEPFIFRRSYSVEQWESRFWRFKIQNESLDIYAATIDTTFAVYRKSNFHNNLEEAIRVAGNYSCIHLPWFPDLDLFSDAQRQTFKSNNISSTWV